MRLGLDFHGVITADPTSFSLMTRRLEEAECEVHIVTGSRITEALKEQLKTYGIYYTHLFSISDYHHGLGTPMTGYDEHQPKIDAEIWNRTKADYCAKHQISIHIDDSEVYGQHFTTPYALYKKRSDHES